jgi:predicted RNase H-like nuclease (RuvC/YqgF family)
MRDSPSNHKRRIHRLTKDIYQTTKEFYQLTKEIYRPTKAIHQITKAIHQLTKEVHRLSKEIYLKTKEFYQASKDGTLQMIIDSINTDERYNECAVSPFGSLLAALRVMPSAPSGTTCPLANARGQTVVVEALRGLGRPSGQPATYLW